VSMYYIFMTVQLPRSPFLARHFSEYPHNSGANPKGRRYDAGTRVPPAICALLATILVGVKSGLVLLPGYFPA
jgi:hypothetical protein